MDVRFDPDRWLFRLDKEFSGPAHAEGVIGCFLLAFDFKAVFVNDVLLHFRVILLIEDVPAQGFKERVKELPP